MTGQVKALFRNPIKSLGIETLTSTQLEVDRPMAGDRAYALRHAAAPKETGWQACGNFLRVTVGPELAPIRAISAEDGRLTLTHPNQPPLTINPQTDSDALIEWITPLWPDNRPAPADLVTAPDIGMGDNGLAQVSVLNLASLRALSQKLDQPLEIERFRGNIIIDGLAPWEEFDLVGKTVTVGDAKINVTDRIERCRATEANPHTGQRDANTLQALRQGWGHRDFGVYATVTQSGAVQIGDSVSVE